MIFVSQNAAIIFSLLCFAITWIVSSTYLLFSTPKVFLPLLGVYSTQFHFISLLWPVYSSKLSFPVVYDRLVQKYRLSYLGDSGTWISCGVISWLLEGFVFLWGVSLCFTHFCSVFGLNCLFISRSLFWSVIDDVAIPIFIFNFSRLYAFIYLHNLFESLLEFFMLVSNANPHKKEVSFLVDLDMEKVRPHESWA